MTRKGVKKGNSKGDRQAPPGTYQAIVDTPKGSRNKYKYDDQTGRFKLGSVLTAGAIFPYDFGYLPETNAEDGDPLDVLILLDEPAFVGCQIEVRVVGAIEAEQTEAGETMRNDRLVAVAVVAHGCKNVTTLSELGDRFLTEIEHFFVSYNEMKGKTFTPVGRVGARRAAALIAQGRRRYQQTKREA